MDARSKPPLGDPVEVLPYDLSWPALFERERGRLLEAFGASAVAVEHVGSTAVPGLAAKPVLDILATVEPFPPEPGVIAALGRLGYERRGEAGIPGREFFRTSPRTRHLHVFPAGHPEVKRHLLFRDYLRARPEAAREYEALKRDLAARYRLDRGAYTNGKDGLVARLLEEARAWRG